MWMLRADALANIPAYGRALLQLLQLRGETRSPVSLSREEWCQLLSLSDAQQLTLLLGQIGKDCLPAWVAERIHQDHEKQQLRFQRLSYAAHEIVRSFAARGVDVTLLKGFSYAAAFGADPLLRSQGDIDLWCLPSHVFQGREVLQELGYRPFGASKGRHLDPMIREINWKWKGDYYAPDLPIPVDLHYQLWDREMERVPGPDEASVWIRRVEVLSDGCAVRLLAPVDAMSFCALHLMMHVLHGDLRLHRAWELGTFLTGKSDDEAFWSEWRTLYPRPIRNVQLVAFSLTALWFGATLPVIVKEELRTIPKGVALWIERYGWSPVRGLFTPNKDELWLNVTLVDSPSDKLRVAARRLFPTGKGTAQPEVKATRNRRPAIPKLRATGKRVFYHLRLLPRTCLVGARWLVLSLCGK